MNKWINVDVLKARIDQEVKEDKVLSGWAFFFKVYLDEESSIDIVRCKECKHKDAIANYCHENDRNIIADGYCSYGELEESNETN